MSSDVMTLTVIGLGVFAREITHDGKEYKVQAVSVNDAFEELDRVSSLLKNLVANHIDDDVLNEIGFSDEDLSNLGMSSDFPMNKLSIPPRSDWYGE